MESLIVFNFSVKIAFCTTSCCIFLCATVCVCVCKCVFYLGLAFLVASMSRGCLMFWTGDGTWAGIVWIFTSGSDAIF